MLDNFRAAKIDIADTAGRVVDFHALRGVFATRLAQSGCPVHLAQRLLRHGDPRLTLNTYTHANQADMAGAVNSLPPIGAATREFCKAAQNGASGGALHGALTTGISGAPRANSGIGGIEKYCSATGGEEFVSSSVGGGVRDMSRHKNGGDDETRTRDLRRDRPAF